MTGTRLLLLQSSHLSKNLEILADSDSFSPLLPSLISLSRPSVSSEMGRRDRSSLRSDSGYGDELPEVAPRCPTDHPLSESSSSHYCDSMGMNTS